MRQPKSIDGVTLVVPAKNPPKEKTVVPDMKHKISVLQNCKDRRRRRLATVKSKRQSQDGK